jgi:hypothetical protein
LLTVPNERHCRFRIEETRRITDPPWIVERLREKPDDPLTEEEEVVRLVEEVF